MSTQIIRVGNTLTVEVPEELIAQAGIPVGEPVDWVLNGRGEIALVKPSGADSTKVRRRHTLEELLEVIPEGESLGEYDWGPPQGVEVW